MRCPDCDGGLTPTQLAEWELDECSGCGGLWFDPGELSTWGAADSRPPEKASYARFTRHPGGLSWRCPRCATDSLDFGEIAGVGAALCADCRGVFLTGEQVRRLHGLQQGDGEFSLIGMLKALSWLIPGGFPIVEE